MISRRLYFQQSDATVLLVIKRIVMAIILLASATCLSAVEIRAVQWGFDGKVLPEHINVLSVLIANPGAAPIDDRLILRGTGGAPYFSACVLAPGASRWVQFYPWIGPHQDGFELQLGRQVMPLPEPSFGPPAVVLLIEERSLSSAKALKGFPEEIFPTTVAATDGEQTSGSAARNNRSSMPAR